MIYLLTLKLTNKYPRKVKFCFRLLACPRVCVSKVWPEGQIEDLIEFEVVLHYITTLTTISLYNQVNECGV